MELASLICKVVNNSLEHAWGEILALATDTVLDFREEHESGIRPTRDSVWTLTLT